MHLRPLYDRIVVRRIEQKEQMQGGIIIPDSAKEKLRKVKASPLERANAWDMAA